MRFGFEEVAPFHGMALVESSHLTIPGPDDWSRVRSPGRARRRLKRGYRQNIRPTLLPNPPLFVCEGEGKVFGHPATLATLRRQIESRHADQLEAAFIGGPSIRPTAPSPSDAQADVLTAEFLHEISKKLLVPTALQSPVSPLFGQYDFRWPR